MSNVDPRPSPRPAGGTASFRPQAEDLAELSQPVDAGAVRIEVQQAFPLSDAARAHEVSRKGHLPGKLILEV